MPEEKELTPFSNHDEMDDAEAEATEVTRNENRPNDSLYALNDLTADSTVADGSHGSHHGHQNVTERHEPHEFHEHHDHHEHHEHHDHHEHHEHHDHPHHAGNSPTMNPGRSKVISLLK